MSAAPSGGSQCLLLAVFLLVCFGATFYTYYKPTMTWFTSSCPSAPHAAPPPGCSSKCLALLGNLTGHRLNLSSTLPQGALEERGAGDGGERGDGGGDVGGAGVGGAGGANGSDTIVLIWAWPFGFKFGAESCVQFGVSGCTFTDNRMRQGDAHAVLFHLRDIRGDLSLLLTLHRPPGQKWAWMNMESPDNSAALPGAEDLFNLTTNFRRDSDVWVPYGRIVARPPPDDEDFRIPAKDKLLCWVVSNWSERFRRVSYFNELSKHIQVEAYGGHFGRPITTEDYHRLMPSCKFYLAFENSVHRDYFTEKLFNPLAAGTVPVVLGPPRGNYEEYLPADSFIHVDDFGSPRELAEHLRFLDGNQEEYKRYFGWRRHYVARGTAFGLENACRVCEHVQRHREYRVVKNVNKWYWG